MRSPRIFFKTHSSSRLINFVLLASSALIVYILVSLFLFHTCNYVSITRLYAFSLLHNSCMHQQHLNTLFLGLLPTTNHGQVIKSSLASGGNHVRCVFLNSFLEEDTSSNNTLPPICTSEHTSRFRYTKRGGLRSAIRVARVVLETISHNHSDVKWFVFGDADTIFVLENLAKTLSKYDHNLWYYIGSNSEIYEQNRIFSFDMAFGGGGFAISYPLAKVLAKIFDSCIERYTHLYGSDSRVYYCLAELGVGLTREPGFHQFDIGGDAFGLLASHPVAPLVSLHLMHAVDPIFPNRTTSDALRHFFKAVNADPERILQQTVCYDRWFSWTVSVLWCYAVQVFGNHIFLGYSLPPQETFSQWKKSPNFLAGVFTFNTKKLHPDPCRRPTIFLS